MLLSKNALGAFALLLPAGALVLGLPSHPAILGVLNNAAHGPVFALFAIVVARHLRDHTRLSSRIQYLVSFAVALLVGGVIELIQPMIGRDGQIGDLFTDAVGSAGGLGGLALATSQRKLLPGIVVAASCAAIGWPILDAALGYVERARQAPMLLELSTRADWYFLSIQGLDASESELPAPWRRLCDPASIRVQMTDNTRRVLDDFEPIGDWRGYRRLVIDMTNPGSVPLDLTLRIHDRWHNNQSVDRFNRRIHLEASRRIVTPIPLDEIEQSPQGRTLDLANIAGWMLFARPDSALTGQVFYVTRIWLE